ncbi:MAG: type II toxin-antitoxin system PemK/MazF family toxin [Cyanobacteria bacterium P01_C01_bin.147]
MAKRYVPDRGHIVYLDFNPTKGHEQRGTRPAFVLSPRRYNAKSSLALLMPITSQQKGYPFEVILPPELQIRGVILTDQIKSLDWTVGHIRFVETTPTELVEEVQAKVEPLLL